MTTTVDYRFCSFGLKRRQPTAVKTTFGSSRQPTAYLVVAATSSMSKHASPTVLMIGAFVMVVETCQAHRRDSVWRNSGPTLQSSEFYHR